MEVGLQKGMLLLSLPLQEKQKVALCLIIVLRMTATGSSWVKPYSKPLRNRFSHKALDEITTPQTEKDGMIQHPEK